MAFSELTQKTRFHVQLLEYGIWNIVLSADFLISLALLVALCIDTYYKAGTFQVAGIPYLVAVFAAASTLFAITLASLAIILSFSSSKFAQFLRQHGGFASILFTFWLGNASYLVVLLLSLSYLVISPQALGWIGDYFPSLITAVFVYAVINTFYLLGAVIRFGFFLDFFESNND
jgi:hypothetical protein